MTDHPEEQLDFEHLVIRLIEMGHGHDAIPAIEGASRRLVERGASDEGGYELADLLEEIERSDRREVATWILQAVDDLKRMGGPATAPRRPAPQNADGLQINAQVLPEVHRLSDPSLFQIDRVVRESGVETTQETGFAVRRVPADLAELHFRLAHAFEGAQEIREKHYSLIADLVHEGDRVVDVGAGDGTFLRLVRERGGHGVGIELDPAKVEVCRVAGLDVRHCRAQDFDWDREQVDFVSLLQIVEHMSPDDVLQILSRAAGALSARGRIFIVTPNYVNPFVANMNFWLDVTHVRPYPEQLLSKMLEILGFPYVQSGTMGDGMDTWCYGYHFAEDAVQR